MSSINKICREYNWVCKHIKGPLYRIKMQELYAEVNKAMKDILVHYTYQERDEDTGLYTDVVYKGYIQHWHCGSGYQMAIILNTEGRFHRTTIDKIWVEKEDMPTTK